VPLAQTLPYWAMAKVLTPQDIHALIHLLGDEDAWVKEQARSTLRAAGDTATPYLATAHSASEEPAIRTESATLLEDIHVDDIERDWVDLQARVDGEALEEGAFLLERMILPDCAARIETARGELRELSAGALEAVPEYGPLEERVEGLRRYLHETCGFRGNTDDYYDPDNSFLSSVLIRRTGIPITLALVYLTIGRRIGVRSWESACRCTSSSATVRPRVTGTWIPSSAAARSAAASACSCWSGRDSSRRRATCVRHRWWASSSEWRGT